MTRSDFPLSRRIVLWLLLCCVLLAGCETGADGDEFDFDVPAADFPVNNNLPPLIASFDSYEGVEDTILQVDELFGILSNDEYPINETEIQFPLETVQGGDIDVFQDGSFEYEPPLGFTGQDEFTYTLVDRNGRSSSASVFISVFPVGFRR